MHNCVPRISSHEKDLDAGPLEASGVRELAAILPGQNNISEQQVNLICVLLERRAPTSHRAPQAPRNSGPGALPK